MRLSTDINENIKYKSDPRWCIAPKCFIRNKRSQISLPKRLMY